MRLRQIRLMSWACEGLILNLLNQVVVQRRPIYQIDESAGVVVNIQSLSIAPYLQRSLSVFAACRYLDCPLVHRLADGGGQCVVTLGGLVSYGQLAECVPTY